MHLADAFIQSDLQLHSGNTFLSVYVFPGNRTHNLLRCSRNALPLSHSETLFLNLPALLHFDAYFLITLLYETFGEY